MSNINLMVFIQGLFLLSLIAIVLGETETLLTKPDSESWLWTDYGNKNSGNLIAGWNPPSPVKKRYSVCDVLAKTKPVNWLRSDFIDVTAAKRLDVEVEYSLRCPTKNCQITFSLFVYHVDKNNPAPDPTQVSFDKVADLGPPSPPGRTPTQYVSNASFVTRTAGVYLAFLDSGACFFLTKVTVSYYYCAPRGGLLVRFPRTAALPNNSRPVEQAGECTDEHSVNKTKLSAVCLSNGEWNVTDDAKCLCKAGYELVNGSSNTQKCEECPHGSYKNITDNVKCHLCPLQSSPNPDRTRCDCDDGFYKQDDEALPAAPRQANTTAIEGTSVVIKWVRSTDDNGQLRYSVDCFKCKNENDKSCGEPCSERITYSPRKMNITGISVSVSGLSTSSFYVFRINSVNNLNQLEKDKDKWNYVEVFLQATECPPGSYKNITVNFKCHLCPLQSSPNPDRTSCDCDDGFYKKNDVINECKALPTAPRQVNTTAIEGTSVVIKWVRSTDDNGQLRYSVECFQCQDEKDKSCGEPCRREIKYSPRKMDITGISVSVSGLSTSSFYLFRVYSVNNLNQLEKDRNKWNYAAVFLQTKALPTAPRQSNTNVDGTSVVIWWVRSPDDNGQLRYSVDCLKCKNEKDKSCGESCSGRVKYSPRKMDIDGVSVRVSGLSPFSFFLFRVYSVNELNQFEKDRDKWNYDEVYVKTEVSPTQQVTATEGPTIPKNLIIICVLAGLLAVSIASIGSYIIYKRARNRRRRIMENEEPRTQNREASALETVVLSPVLSVKT